MRHAICLLVVAALLTACGYKGPLYLPKDKPGAQAPAKTPAPQQDEVKPAEEP